MIAKCGDHAIDHLLAIRWRERTPQPGTRRGGSAENAIVSGHRPSRLERLPAAALASPTLTGLLGAGAKVRPDRLPSCRSQARSGGQPVRRRHIRRRGCANPRGPPREDSVEVLPPPRISHTPETYQRAARERGCPGFHATTCSVSVSDRDSTSITFLSGTRSTQCLDLAPLVREY